MIARVVLAAMLMLCGCSGMDAGDVPADMVESAARAACQAADNCEDHCTDGAVVEHSRAICVDER